MPNGTGYSNLLNFPGTPDGQGPSGDRIYEGKNLYGMTPFGGAKGAGEMFKIRPNGTGYDTLLNFSGLATGSTPVGSLFSDGTFLYGTTANGGINNSGVIFKYKYCSTITDSVTIVPATCGNNNGSAFVIPSGGVGIYSYLWSNGSTTSIVTGLTGQPTDTLLITIADSLGCWYTDTAIVACIAGIAENNAGMHFTISPNPFSSSTTLQTDWLLKNYTLIVYNSVGQTVKQMDNLSGQTIILNRNNLPSGLYFVRLTENNKTLAVDKLVITDK